MGTRTAFAREGLAKEEGECSTQSQKHPREGRQTSNVFALWFSLIFSHTVLRNLFMAVSTPPRSTHPTNDA